MACGPASRADSAGPLSLSEPAAKQPDREAERLDLNLEETQNLWKPETNGTVLKRNLLFKNVAC